MKKLIAIILLITVSAVSLSGCFGSGKDKSEINIYFKNIKTNEFVIEEFEYSGAQNTVDMANFALSMLKAGPQKADNTSTIPKNVNCSDVVVADEIATVDFSKEFKTLTGVDAIMARFSVIRTLCDIPGISGVLITVDGNPLISNSTGEKIGVIYKKDIVLGIESIGETETTNVKLYFATSDMTALKAEEHKVETQDTVSIEKTIINELIKGPSSPELVSVIPSGTKLLSVETKEGVCYVNLSGEFISKFSGGTGKLTISSIVNSLCNIESISSVQFLIEGEKGAKFGEYLFDEPIEPDLTIVVTK